MFLLDWIRLTLWKNALLESVWWSSRPELKLTAFTMQTQHLLIPFFTKTQWMCNILSERKVYLNADVLPCKRHGHSRRSVLWLFLEKRLAAARTKILSGHFRGVHCPLSIPKTSDNIHRGCSASLQINEWPNEEDGKSSLLQENFPSGKRRKVLWIWWKAEGFIWARII